MPLILLVDDDSDLRRALRRQLERASYDVYEADSALAGLVAVAEVEPAVVVSDVLMPGIDGLDFYEEVIARTPRLKGRVIFLTGAALDPLVNQRVEEFGAPLIGKLDDLRVVVDAVRLALVTPAPR